MKINILGKEYKVGFANVEYFEKENDDIKYSGLCHEIEKKIEIATKGYKEEVIYTTLIHEIIHAFIFESGCECQIWNTEECIDWFAYQIPKILDIANNMNFNIYKCK